MRRALGLILVVTIIGLSARAVAIAAPATKLVDATLLADTAAVEPGRPFMVGVLLKIQPKWHVYWKNPGDSGIATTVDFAVPGGFTVGELQYPVPQRLNLAGGIVSFGYEDEVMLLATVVPPSDLRTGASVKIGANVNWLVCQENCIPGDAALSLELPVSAEARPRNQELFAQWKSRLPGAAKEGTVKVSGDDRHMQVRAQTPPGVKDVEWFPPATDAETIKDVKVAADGEEWTTIDFTVDRPAGQKASTNLLQSVLAYTTPDGKRTGVIVPIRWSH